MSNNQNENSTTSTTVTGATFQCGEAANNNAGQVQQLDQMAVNTLITSCTSCIQIVQTSLIPRLNECEKNQKNISSTIERERIIEDATRRLLNINITLFIVISILFIILCIYFSYYYASDEIKNFFTNYNIPMLLFSIPIFGFIAKALYDIHGYSKRLEAIEKTLKLNGNV